MTTVMTSLVSASPLRASPLRWGGLIETIYTQFSENDIPENIKTLAKKVTLCESTKTIEEIRYCLHFTKTELDYLNSPLLDEIFETMFMGDPLKNAILHDKLNAFLFYAERVEEKEEELWIRQAEHALPSLKILTYFLENKKVDNLEEKILQYFDEGREMAYFNKPWKHVLLLYLEYIPEITASLMEKINEYYDFALHTREILEAFLKKINCIKAAEHFLDYVIYDENFENENIIILEKILKKFPTLPLQNAIKATVYCNTEIIYTLLQYEKCTDVKTIKYIVEMAIECMEIKLLKLLENEYSISPILEFKKYVTKYEYCIFTAEDAEKFTANFCKTKEDILTLLEVTKTHENLIFPVKLS